MNKISVIVPIYNVENYILFTLKSIINQTFKDFELILVNDGSTDNSIKVASDYLNSVNKDFELITQKNAGVSSARNKGIRSSNCEWIICIDSDDILESDFLSDLYLNTIKFDCQLGIMNFNKLHIDDYIEGEFKKQKSFVISANQIREKFLLRKINIIVPGVLIKKSILINNELFYDESVRFSEDMIFLWRLLYSIEKIYYNPTPMYNYIIREASIMHFSPQENILSGYYGMNKMLNKLPKAISIRRKNLILARWVFGALQTVIRTHTYDSGFFISKKIFYRYHFKKLLFFSDFRVVILSIIGLVNFRVLFKIVKKMGSAK